MTAETPFGTTADADAPFDSEGRCACGGWSDLDGTTCVACFDRRWDFKPRSFDPMVELLDALGSPAPTIPLAA